jgi:hypothetical protein
MRRKQTPPLVVIESFNREGRRGEKRSKIGEREEKKRETEAKPLNINASNAWRCGDRGIRASGPRRNEIRRAKGMARRIKQNQHWAGVCAGMAMAQVYIEPITLETGAAVEGPADRREPFKLFGPPPGGGDGLGGGRGEVGRRSQDDEDKAKQSKEERKKERNRPLSEEHKNKRRKLKQLELGQLMWGAPDKDG